MYKVKIMGLAILSSIYFSGCSGARNYVYDLNARMHNQPTIEEMNLAAKENSPETYNEKNEIEKFTEERAKSTERLDKALAALARKKKGVRFSCGWIAAAFLNRLQAPDKNCVYSMTHLIPYQKVEDGYLVKPDGLLPASSACSSRLCVAFFATKHRLTEGSNIDRKAYWSGTYDFVGINGFSERVISFSEYSGPALAVNPNELLQDALHELEWSLGQDETGRWTVRHSISFMDEGMNGHRFTKKDFIIAIGNTASEAIMNTKQFIKNGWRIHQEGDSNFKIVDLSGALIATGKSDDEAMRSALGSVAPSH